MGHTGTNIAPLICRTVSVIKYPAGSSQVRPFFVLSRQRPEQTGKAEAFSQDKQDIQDKDKIIYRVKIKCFDPVHPVYPVNSVFQVFAQSIMRSLCSICIP
jgi:hypothetical protein